MKIVQIIPDNRDESGRYDLKEPRFGPAKEALLDGFASQPDCEIHVVSCVKQTVTAPARLADNIHYHALVVPQWGWLRSGYWGCIRAVRRALRKIAPDVVEGQGSERYAAMAAAWSGFPNVVTLHGNLPAVARFFKAPIGSYFWLAARLENLAVRKTGGVFCNSAYTENLVAPRARRTWRVPNAVRRAILESPAGERLLPPRLLNIGNIVAYKKQLAVLDMAAAWHREGLRFVLEFIGDGSSADPYYQEFRARMAAVSAQGYAVHRGVLGREELIGAMDAASGLLHFSAEESFGLVVAEALARNRKVFTARVGGLPDIAEGVDGAELFALGDWAAVNECVAKWLVAGAPLPARAAAAMRERYPPGVIARRRLEIYRELLK